MSWVADMRKVLDAADTHQLTSASPQAPQPTHITIPLRPHQRTLLAAARALEDTANITALNIDEPQLLTPYGVIADRVGAGKSIIALSLLADKAPVVQSQMSVRESGATRILRYNLKERPPVLDLTPELLDISGGAAFMKAIRGDNGCVQARTALVITPHTVVPQWEAYIRDQTTLRSVIVRRTSDCDYENLRFFHNVFAADVVVVSTTMVKRFFGALLFHGGYPSKIIWSRVFVDEADSISLPIRASDISARFFWFITGSHLNMIFSKGIYSYRLTTLPADIQLRLGSGAISGITGSATGFVNAMVADSLEPILLRTILRNSEPWIEESLSQPVVTHETILCKAPASLGILQNFVTPAALEALHAGDIAGALAALGLEATSKESIIEAVTAGLRHDIDQAEKLLAFKHTMDYSTPAAKADGIARAESKVTALKEKLAALEARVSGMDSELCPICYDTPHTPTLTPCCRQTFCLACVCECVAKKPTCPLCRVAIKSVKELLVVGSGSSGSGSGILVDADVDDGPSTKGAALLKLLSGISPADRYLVFSAHEASFKGLREVLATRGIKCELLMGTASRIQRLRKQFIEGKVQVLCMNARHVGAGLNLEMATHVVLYHKMNVELERQVIGRALRFERAAELRVIHLAHEGESGLTMSNSEVIVHA
jgi:SNF2 family DNA or RNA helicase